MPRIRITSTPPGFAPLEIREQWVGVEIPLASSADFERNAPGLLRLGTENLGGYRVTGVAAISALESAGKNDAASFWRGLPNWSIYLEFSRNCAELIADEQPA